MPRPGPRRLRGMSVPGTASRELAHGVRPESALDYRYCSALMATMEAVGARWEVRRATPALGRRLPRTAGLYMFVWRPYFRLTLSDGASQALPFVLYVGRAGGSDNSNTLRARYAEYAELLRPISDPVPAPLARNSRLKELFAIAPLEFWYCAPSEVGALPLLERRLIDVLLPPGNFQKPRFRVRRIIPT